MKTVLTKLRGNSKRVTRESDVTGYKQLIFNELKIDFDFFCVKNIVKTL